MEVLVEVVEALALAVVPPRVFAGVPVREVEALEVAVLLPNCFVGDFVGDYMGSMMSVEALSTFGVG